VGTISRTPAASLDNEDRRQILENFSDQWDTSSFPFRARDCSPARPRLPLGKLDAIARTFSQARFPRSPDPLHLQWCGSHPCAVFPSCQNSRQLPDFTEQEKNTVLASTGKSSASSLPEYRAAADRGQVEVDTTPYFHPNHALVSTHIRAPGRPVLPSSSFSAPRCPRAQRRLAQERHEHVFAIAPARTLASEGSIAPDIVRLWAMLL